MGEVFIVRRGGGGASVKDTDALLRVGTPINSTVTIGRDSKTLSPNWYAVTGSIQYAYFIIKASSFSATAWTITVSKNGQSASKTQVINSAGEYDVSFALKTVYFDNGFLGESGGFEQTVSQGDFSVGNELYLYGSGGIYNIACALNKLDVTFFNNMKVIGRDTGTVKVFNGVGLLADKTSAVAARSANMSRGENTEVNVDISSIYGEFYVGLFTKSYSGTNHSEFYVSYIEFT